MYYVEEIDKPCGSLRKMFPKVSLKENKIYIIGLDKESKEKKLIKLAKKTDKTLKKTKSNKIVLSKMLQKNDIYKNMLYTYGYDIADGQWLFEGIANKVLDYVVIKKNIQKEECQISVLVNNLKDYTLQNIKNLAKEYKTVNIVTNHIDKFKKIEENILDESGLIITVTNNKKKSLVKSKIILNIDFPNELINKYNIYDDAIIINICGNIKILKKRFNGLVINDYDIDINNENIKNTLGKSIHKYYLKQVYEAEFYKNMTFQDFTKKLKRDKCELTKLYSMNGVL